MIIQKKNILQVYCSSVIVYTFCSYRVLIRPFCFHLQTTKYFDLTDVYDYQGRDYNDVEYYDYPQSLGMDYGAYYSWPYYGQQMVYPGMASRRQLSSASGSYRPTKGMKEPSSARRFIFPRHKSYVKLGGRRSAKSRYF